MTKPNTLAAMFFVLIITISALGCTNYNSQPKENFTEICNNQLNSQKINVTNFFKDYSIALNNIYSGKIYIQLSDENLNNVQDAVSNTSTGYYYSDAKEILEFGKEKALEAKDFFTRAKIKLQNIQDTAPNDLFETDVSNRIEQCNVLIAYSEHEFLFNDYEEKILYELNYGSEINQTNYENKYDALIPIFNSNLKNLSDIQNRIDLAWDQDWYGLYQGD